MADSWDIATWEGHEKEQLLRQMRLPMAEKLDWLEEAQEMAECLAVQRESTAGKQSVQGNTQIDSLVEKVVKRIVEAYHPTRVILFGSRARGDARPDSDIDLLVLYDGPLSRRDVELGIRRLFTPQTFSMDLFVMSSEDFERQKDVVSSIGRAANKQGVICYAQ